MLELLSTTGIIVASIVGVASVLTGILYFQPQIFGAKEPFTTITIEGLKTTYRTGEPIDFIVKIEGYGCNGGFPTVMIKNTSGEAVWSRSGEFRLFPAGYSCPLEEVYNVRHIGDLERYSNDEQERMRTKGGMPIVMNVEGEYAVEVEARSPAVKEFTVIAS